MKDRSFSSILKNMEMALGLDNVNSYSVIDHNHKVLFEVCFKSSEEATHKRAAPEVRKNWFCTFANFKAFKTTSMLLKVLRKDWKWKETHVDLMVMQRSCSSFLVSVALVSPAFEAAMMPACEKYWLLSGVLLQNILFITVSKMKRTSQVHQKDLGWIRKKEIQ